MMSRRFPRAHNGDGPTTVAACAAARDLHAMRHIWSVVQMAPTGDDHVN
jgi:hypothetical protein